MAICIWDFYTAWFTDYTGLHFIAIIELIFFLLIGILIIKFDRKTPRKTAMKKLLKASLFSQLLVPPAEAFIFCYPIWIAFLKNFMLISIMWIGVGLWVMFLSMMRRKNTKMAIGKAESGKKSEKKLLTKH